MGIVPISGARPAPRRAFEPSINITKNAERIPFLNKLQTFLKIHEAKSLIAYFCMEYGLRESLPIYGGGLGILAGDTVKSAADQNLPFVGVGLLYREGNFVQKFDKHNWQIEEPVKWDPEKEGLEDLEIIIKVPMNGDHVDFKLWGCWVEGKGGKGVPLILLDSALESNANNHDYFNITNNLYAKEWLEFAQRVALGIGGMMALEELGLDPDIIHLNEGHGAFACGYAAWKDKINPEDEKDMEKLRSRFVFTTHTPVPAGFDHFHRDSVKNIFHSLPEIMNYILAKGEVGNHVYMEKLAGESSRVINAVSELHAEITRTKVMPQFRDKTIHVTNGVHHLTWTSPPFREFYDQFCAGWREDPRKLKELLDRRFETNFKEGLWRAHQDSKRLLIKFINEATGREFNEDVFTIGFARRAAGYKRANLLFYNTGWLWSIAENKGPIQLVFAGKAHRVDHDGKKMIQMVRGVIDSLRGKVNAVFIDDHNMNSGHLLTSGVDVWLNNPLRPNEASGTSGMKAALNGVPSLSTDDGWWAEADQNLTGWTFGLRHSEYLGDNFEYNKADASELYYTLEKAVPLYYQLLGKVKENNLNEFDRFLNRMIHSIALNASNFNTHRMVLDYAAKVWEIEA